MLALEHNVIPPNIYFNTPNPHVEWKEWNLHVPTEVTPWPKNACERISVNCFGIGGANAHAVLDSARSFHLPRHKNCISEQVKDNAQLLVVSARSEAALKKRVEDIVKYISETPSKMRDLAHTLGVRREHLSNRAFAVVQPCSAKQVSSTDFRLRKALESKVTFVFTGQGPQWPEMGKSLMESFQGFRDDIRSLDSVLQSLDAKPDWRLEGKLFTYTKFHEHCSHNFQRKFARNLRLPELARRRSHSQQQRQYKLESSTSFPNGGSYLLQLSDIQVEK